MDQARFLCDRNEFLWRNLAEFFVRPAQQGLCRDYPAGADCDDRLKHQSEFVSPQRVPQVVFQPHPFDRGGIHRRVVIAITVASPFFRRIHRDVGILQQFLWFCAALRIGRDADAGAYEELVVTDKERCRQDLEHLRCALLPVRLFGHLRADDEKLITTQSRYGVTVAHAGLQALRRLAQQLVSGSMAERVVHLLEPVQIQEHGEHASAIALRPFDCLGQAVQGQVTVRQSCELVVIGLVGELLFGFDTLVDFTLKAFILLVEFLSLLSRRLETRGKHQITSVQSQQIGDAGEQGQCYQRQRGEKQG